MNGFNAKNIVSWIEDLKQKVNTLMYFDSHAHLTDPDLLCDLPSILERAKIANITEIVNIATTPTELEEGFFLQKNYPFLRQAGATPPHTAQEEGVSAFPVFERAALEKKMSAIGETGLDYYSSASPKEVQKALLIKYLHLAAKTKLPVIFHCREAFSDLFSIVDQEYPKKADAILHCFTGTMREAECVLERGWYLSLSGIVSFKKSESLREIAKTVPLSQLLIETDAPYLAPQTQRGKRNEPAFLVETALCIAHVKGISVEALAKATRENGKKLFLTN